jgi:hypothetical protein
MTEWKRIIPQIALVSPNQTSEQRKTVACEVDLLSAAGVDFGASSRLSMPV